MTHRVHFVLIRGLLREARHWGVFINHLQNQFPDALISTPDIPGNGMHHHEISPKTIIGMTDALRQQITADRPLRLVALSMGGMIAIDWMTRYPNEVEAAVLINTSARPLSPFYRRLRWAIYPCILQMIFHSAAQKEADILKLTSNYHAHDDQLLKSWQQWQQHHPVSTTSAMHQFLAALSFSITGKPLQRVLIVTSQADRLVDYRCSQKLAQSWRTSYIEHESAGHDLPLDEPGWLVNSMRQWFYSGIDTKKLL